MSVEEFLKAIRRGVDWGPKPFKLLWTSPDQRYAIFTAPGHNYRSGQDTKHGGTNHYLVCVQVQPKNNYGWNLFCDAKLGEVEGRMNKAKMAELISKIPK